MNVFSLIKNFIHFKLAQNCDLFLSYKTGGLRGGRKHIKGAKENIFFIHFWPL